MKRLVLLPAALLSALALAFAALSSGSASVQAEILPVAPTPQVGSTGPRPSAPGLTSLGPPATTARAQSENVNVCALGAEYHHWGDETLILANFTIDLPHGGDFMVATITRPAGQAASVEVCYRPDASVLRLSDVSGGEVSRQARSGDAHWAFDAIVGSVRSPFNASLGVRVPTLTTVAP